MVVQRLTMVAEFEQWKALSQELYDYKHRCTTEDLHSPLISWL